MTYLNADCCCASFCKSVTSGKQKEGVCLKLLSKCKRHIKRRKREEIWPPKYFHPLFDKDGPTTDDDAIKGSVSADMMGDLYCLRHLALKSVTE